MCIVYPAHVKVNPKSPKVVAEADPSPLQVMYSIWMERFLGSRVGRGFSQLFCGWTNCFS